jgi:hypothetical membrane protein
MNRKLINWLGLTGIVAFVSYTLAVVISPSAFPGYNWMEQAVSDLSAESAPSRMLWNQIAALYGVCSVVCVTCVSVYVSENKVSTRLFRMGMYLFSIMNWISSELSSPPSRFFAIRSVISILKTSFQNNLSV